MKKVWTSTLFSLVCIVAFSQSTTLTPGSILPNMTSAQRIAVVNPPNGMLVFDSNTQSYWFRQNSAWVELPKGGSTSNYWELNGLAGNELKNTNSGGFWSANASSVPSDADNISNPPTVPINGDGTRLMWIPSRSAFRAGTVNNNTKSWDADSIGLFSTAIGLNSKASNNYSTAIGAFVEATGIYSFATGRGNLASGESSVVMGVANNASGNLSFAIGNFTRATGSVSTAMGFGTEASGRYSIATGWNTIASGQGSTAMGLGSEATGKYTTTMGLATEAKAQSGVSLGEYNDNLDNPTSSTSSNDRLFQIGNGSFNSRSNAMTVLRNGTIGINNINLPESPLHIKGIGTDRYSHLVLERSNSTENSKVFTNILGLNFENSLSPMNFNFRDAMGDIKAVIANNGFIGSQLVTPLAPLHLGNGPNTWERHIRLDYDASTNEFGNIVYDDQGMKFRAWGTGDNIYFRNNANAHIATIFNTGNMSIAGTLTQNSDRRLKTNLDKVQNSGTKLAQLQAYHYNWIATDSDPNLQTGLIAQEVQMQFPELVNEGENGYLSVNYIGLIPHLIEANKELLDQNKLLTDRLNAIENLLKINQEGKAVTASTK